MFQDYSLSELSGLKTFRRQDELTMDPFIWQRDQCMGCRTSRIRALKCLIRHLGDNGKQFRDLAGVDDCLVDASCCSAQNMTLLIVAALSSGEVEANTIYILLELWDGLEG